MAFKYNKTVKLDEFGWADCELVLTGTTFKEAKVNQDRMKGLDPEDPKSFDMILSSIQDKFVSGQAINEKNEKVELKAEDLGDMPIDILLYAIKQLNGTEANAPL